MNEKISLDNLPESRFWDHEKSATEVITSAEYVYLDMSKTSGKHDDGFHGMRILIPNNKDKGGDGGFTEIGIDQDGFTYESDMYPDKEYTDKDWVIKMTPIEAIKAMIFFQKAVVALRDLNEYSITIGFTGSFGLDIRLT